MAEEQHTKQGFRPLNKAKTAGLRQKTALNQNIAPEPVRSSPTVTAYQIAEPKEKVETLAPTFGPAEARQGMIMAIIFGKPRSKSGRRW